MERRYLNSLLNARKKLVQKCASACKAVCTSAAVLYKVLHACFVLFTFKTDHNLFCRPGSARTRWRCTALPMPPNQGSIPPTTKALFSQLPPFPLVLPSPPFLSCREAAPLKPARGLGSTVSSPSGVQGKAPADIDFGVF